MMGRLMEPLGLYDAGYESSMSYVSTCKPSLLSAAALVAQNAQHYFKRCKLLNCAAGDRQRLSAAAAPRASRCVTGVPCSRYCWHEACYSD